jgi:hypothetical protein
MERRAERKNCEFDDKKQVMQSYFTVKYIRKVVWKLKTGRNCSYKEILFEKLKKLQFLNFFESLQFLNFQIFCLKFSTRKFAPNFIANFLKVFLQNFHLKFVTPNLLTSHLSICLPHIPGNVNSVAPQ